MAARIERSLTSGTHRIGVKFCVENGARIGTCSEKGMSMSMLSAERAIAWNLAPAPTLMLATNPDVDGIDFREFAIEGEGSFDYGCAVLQAVAAIDDRALSVRSPNCPDFKRSRGNGSSRICLPGDRVKGE
jgi:hypothetical protein